MLQRSMADQVFDALGDATRRSIIDRLSRGPASVSDLAKPLDISLAAVLQHVQVLEQCGLVHSAKVGRVRTCKLRERGLTVIEGWIRQRRSLWERRFDRLAEVLGEAAEGEGSVAGGEQTPDRQDLN